MRQKKLHNFFLNNEDEEKSNELPCHGSKTVARIFGRKNFSGKYTRVTVLEP